MLLTNFFIMEYRTKHLLFECLDTQKEFLIVQPFETKSDKHNELLFFLKPGFFLLDTVEHRKEALKLVLQKMTEFEIEISGAALISGTELDKAQIMDRHYGYINKVSKNASKMIHSEELETFRKKMPDFDIDKAIILGGHEFLEQFPLYNAQTLNTLWASAPSHKMRSGFYFHNFDIDGKYIVLVNGFHPEQLFKFTNPKHKILVFLLHSDTNWRVLKDDFAGATYPQEAIATSIRGALFADQNKYGTHEISIANNFVHLSAGPFEGFFEMNNFLTNMNGVDFDIDNTCLTKEMNQKGLNHKDNEFVLTNPIAEINGKETDLFTFTENFNSVDAVDAYVKYFKK